MTHDARNNDSRAPSKREKKEQKKKVPPRERVLGVSKDGDVADLCDPLVELPVDAVVGDERVAQHQPLGSLKVGRREQHQATAARLAVGTHGDAPVAIDPSRRAGTPSAERAEQLEGHPLDAASRQARAEAATLALRGPFRGPLRRRRVALVAGEGGDLGEEALDQMANGQ